MSSRLFSTLYFLLDHRSDPHLLRDQEGLIIVVCGVFCQFTKHVSLELCLFRAVELDFVANVGLWRHSGGLVGWTSSQKNCHPTSISSTSISTSILQHTKRFLLMRTSHNNNREQMVLQRIDLNCVTSIFFCFFLFFLLFVESVAKPSS